MPVARRCRTCNEVFHTKPSWIKLGKGVYCSNVCRHKQRLNGRDTICYICGKQSYRSLARIQHSKSQKFFCSKSCQTKWRNTEFIGPKHANWKGGRGSYNAMLRRNGILTICTLCRTRDSRILAVHHIDHDRDNNKLENLAWLCHNCHFLVHHDSVERLKFQRRIRK